MRERGSRKTDETKPESTDARPQQAQGSQSADALVRIEWPGREDPRHPPAHRRQIRAARPRCAGGRRPGRCRNYFQHGEHYFRIVSGAQEQNRPGNGGGYGSRSYDDDLDEGDDEGNGGSQNGQGYAAHGYNNGYDDHADPGQQPQPYEMRPDPNPGRDQGQSRDNGQNRERFQNRDQRRDQRRFDNNGRQDYQRQDQPRQDQPRQDQTRQEQTRQDQPRQDYQRQDGQRNDQPRQEQPRQDYARQDRQDSRQDGRQENGRQDYRQDSRQEARGDQGRYESGRAEGRSDNRQERRPDSRTEAPRNEASRTESPRQAEAVPRRERRREEVAAPAEETSGLPAFLMAPVRPVAATVPAEPQSVETVADETPAPKARRRRRPRFEGAAAEEGEARLPGVDTPTE